MSTPANTQAGKAWIVLSDGQIRGGRYTSHDKLERLEVPEIYASNGEKEGVSVLYTRFVREV